MAIAPSHLKFEARLFTCTSLEDILMPYYIYKIGPLNILEKQGQADSFKEAKAAANALRKQLDPNAGQAIKMIFAENELAAEDILSQPRELDPTLSGDDY